jgi:hypothetical protein
MYIYIISLVRGAVFEHRDRTEIHTTNNCNYLTYPNYPKIRWPCIKDSSPTYATTGSNKYIMQRDVE